jgi:hypothetical protein
LRDMIGDGGGRFHVQAEDEPRPDMRQVTLRNIIPRRWQHP